MVCSSEGDDPKDSHHIPLTTMTFTLRINNIQTSSSKLDLMQAKDLKLSTKADPLTAHKDNESPDEFFIKDDEGASSGFATKSSLRLLRHLTEEMETTTKVIPANFIL